MDQPLGVDPAQGMATDGELPRVVGQDHGVGQQAMGLDRSPYRSFGGDQHRIGRHNQRRDPEPLQMPGPSRFVGEPMLGISLQPGDH